MTLQILEIEVRRHNGQCQYGEWMPISEVPLHVGESIADEIADPYGLNTEKAGMVILGGQRWIYRRRESV